MIFQVGDQVRLLAPFDVPYPGTFTVVRVNSDGAYVSIDMPGYDNGSDFDPSYLVKV